MGGRPWTTTELRELRVARAAGHSLDDIAAGLGRSRSAVRNAVERNKIPPPGWGCGRLQAAIMATLQSGPLSPAEIVARVPARYNSVYVTLSRLGQRGHIRKIGGCRWGINHG